MATKICKKCKEVKDVSEFRLRDWGYSGTCRDCERDDSLNRYYQNAEQYREKSKEWKRNNKEKIREYKRKSYWADPEKERKYRREQYARNPLVFIENALRWAKENPEKKNEMNRNRRAREIANGGTITAEEWQELKDKYNHTCLKCGRREPEIKLTLDHVVPISKGGINSIENAQPLCLSCNSRKKDKTIDYRS